jgi:hypothetical protein
MRNACLDVALRELAAAGIRDVVQAPGGKHWQIQWQANGECRMYSLPVTPSDHRAAANTRAEIRRMLRADGFLVDQPKPVKVQPPSLQDEIRWLKAEIRNLKDRMAKLEGVNDEVQEYSEAAG